MGPALQIRFLFSSQYTFAFGFCSSFTKNLYSNGKESLVASKETAHSLGAISCKGLAFAGSQFPNMFPDPLIQSRSWGLGRAEWARRISVRLKTGSELASGIFRLRHTCVIAEVYNHESRGKSRQLSFKK